ncbi:MAG TPA: 50S ribosomal protein L15 [Gemmatimonadales bacterium]|nr:50S ribosomal protein L15 [Gemmatimonadales bacterium]
MAHDDKTERVTLSTLRPAPGSRPGRKRIGRGVGSGLGKTSGKGHKGHKARTGGSTNPGFEGGQMPMYRRLPKRGFTNPFKVVYQVVNLRQLEGLAGTEVSPSSLHAAHLVAEPDRPVKLLGAGEADRAYTVRGVAVSASARTKIEAAGGTVEA